MSMRALFATILIAAAVIASPAAQAPQSTAAPGAAAREPVVLDAGRQRVRVVTLASGLVHPWSIAELPAASTPPGAGGATLLVTERPGRLRIIRNGVLDPQPVWTVPGSGDNAADRLHFVALHPRFAENRFVYLSHPRAGDKTRGGTIAISRGRFDGATLVDVKEIFVADAWEQSGNTAGRIYFGPDQMLYMTVGDRDRLCCIGKDDTSIRILAQDLRVHNGKTLRLRDDGGVPPDNPFVGRADAKPEIFTYGHRNGYGLAVHPETRELWQAEIGPLGGDEVNVLKPGANYGWPLVSMGRNYTGTLVSDQPWFRPGMENPRVFWVPSISPSSLLWYTGDKFPAWKNSLLIGALTTRTLIRMSFDQPSQAERRDLLLTQLNTRFRDVIQGSDGLIYVATEQQSGGAAADGTVLRLEPAEPAVSATR